MCTATTLGFDLTYRCNLRCKMCRSWQVEDDRPELTAAQVIEIARRFRERLGIRKVRFVGGEPLLREDLPVIIDAISRWCTTEIVTNGTTLTDDLAQRLVDAGLHQLRVSVDGPEPTHDALRGKGTFRLTRAGIAAVRRARERAGRTLPLLRVYACISRMNAHQLGDLRAIAGQVGADFQFGFLGDMTHVLTPDQGAPGVPRQRDPGGLQLSSHERARLLKEAARLQRPGTWKAALSASVSRAIAAARGAVLGRRYRDCDRSREYVLVDPWGDVVPCEHLSAYSYGSALEQGPDVWWSTRRSDRRAEIRRGALAVCRECNALGVHRYPPRALRALKRFLAGLGRAGAYDAS